MSTLAKGSKKLLNAWAFYDWANSVYPLVISTAIFPLYYDVLFPVDNPNIIFLSYEFKSTAFISFVIAFAFLCVAFISPILSGIADFVGNKKRFMQFFCYLGAFSCIGMYWFTKDNIYFGIVCFFFGLIGFWGSLVFYNSYLPDIAYKEQQDTLSAKGYSFGYIGSVVLLLINLYMILSKDDEKEAVHAMRLSFAMTGIWWILFAQYTFYFLPKGNKSSDKITKDVFFNGFRELKKVQSQLYQNLRLYRYLVAFFVYSMAVQTIMLVATYFGAKEIQWEDVDKTKGLIISVLVIQLVAIVGATLTSIASKRYGNIKMLIVLNAIWSLICLVTYFFVTEPIHFYITAGFVGLVMGGIQALSRSTYSKFLPKTDDTASYFSFYDVAEKIGIVIGMAIYGSIDQITGSMRNAIVFLGAFFVAGLILLLRVPKNTAFEENDFSNAD
jgi:UMF1 family MFS transporter